MAVDDRSADGKLANEKPVVDSRPGWSEGLPLPKILAGNGAATPANSSTNPPTSAPASPPAARAPREEPPRTASPAPAQTLPASSSAPVVNLNMVLDIPVQLSVELGRTRVPIKQVLQLKPGSIVELDSVAGEPVDVLVNGYLIAQGEVVVVNGKFGIRLTDVVTPSERFKRLGKS